MFGAFGEFKNEIAKISEVLIRNRGKDLKTPGFNEKKIRFSKKFQEFWRLK